MLILMVHNNYRSYAIDREEVFSEDHGLRPDSYLDALKNGG
jgi:hypothetical protein